jgi:hypothetical protein
MASKFNMKHEREYALAVSERAPDGVVSSVICLFCKHVGREEDEDEDEAPAVPQKKRRRKTDKTKTWTGPSWRPENYKSHHEGQHSAAWKQQIDEIENQQKILHTAYRTDARIKALLGSHDHSTGFNQAWDMLSSVTYGRLRQFVGGLATVLANTTSIESDFSILKWEKDEYRTCLMDISLEGIFQSKQFEEIGDL